MRGEAAHVAVAVDEVERIAALGWRGLDEAQLGDWILRAAGGFTGRANSALVLGGPPDPGNGWLADLGKWYAERGLPPMAQVPLPGGEAIDTALADAGWRSHDLVRFLTGDITEVQISTAQSLAQATGVISRLDAEPDPAWLAAYKYRGAALPAQARDVLLRADQDTELSFASLRDPPRDGAAGAVLAVARGAVAQGWLGITAVTVADEHRRRGFGTCLMSDLAIWGARRGARAIYLQVASDNDPALALYARLGFHHHHDYRYRIGPVSRGDGAQVY